MRKKPKGRKYRNLYKRGNVIYYEREWKKNRTKQSTDTSDWEIAVAFRDEFERFLRPSHIRPDTPAMRHHVGRWIERECLFTMGDRLVILSFDDGEVGQIEISAGLGVIDHQGLLYRIGGQ